MRRVSVPLMCGLILVGCVTSRGESRTRVSAASQGLPPCPEEVRRDVKGIEASADWRQVTVEGVRFCVPATWAVSGEELRKTQRRPASWSGEGGGLTVNHSRTINQDFTRLNGGDGFMQAEIGGHRAQIFHQPNQSASPLAVQEYYKPKPGGYLTYAVWHDLGVYFAGSARNMKDDGAAAQ
jgi:hypothetical protein